jgi:hypothetical protein
MCLLARLNITDELSKRTRHCFNNNSNIRAPIRGVSTAGCNAAELYWTVSVSSRSLPAQWMCQVLWLDVYYSLGLIREIKPVTTETHGRHRKQNTAEITAGTAGPSESDDLTSVCHFACPLTVLYSSQHCEAARLRHRATMVQNMVYRAAAWSALMGMA